jgi:hypothetical protein
VPEQATAPTHDSPAPVETTAPETAPNPVPDKPVEPSPSATPAAGADAASPRQQPGGPTQKGQGTGEDSKEHTRPLTHKEEGAMAWFQMKVRTTGTGQWPAGYTPSKRLLSQVEKSGGSSADEPGSPSSAAGDDRKQVKTGAAPGVADGGKTQTPHQRLLDQYATMEAEAGGTAAPLAAADWELGNRGFSHESLLDLKPERRLALAETFRAQRNAQPGRSPKSNLPGSRNAVAQANQPAHPARKPAVQTPSKPQSDDQNDPFADLPESVRGEMELLEDDARADLAQWIAEKTAPRDEPAVRELSDSEMRLGQRNAQAVVRAAESQYPWLAQPGAKERVAARMRETVAKTALGDEVFLDVDVLEAHYLSACAITFAKDIVASKASKAQQTATQARNGSVPAPKGNGQSAPVVGRKLTDSERAQVSARAAKDARGDRNKNRELFDRYSREITG